MRAQSHSHTIRCGIEPMKNIALFSSIGTLAFNGNMTAERSTLQINRLIRSLKLTKCKNKNQLLKTQHDDS